MPKLNPLQLTEEERQQLEEIIAHGDSPEAVKRAMTLRLLSQGQHPATVGAMMLVTENTVYAWRRQWQEEGLKGLYARKVVDRAKAIQNTVACLKKRWRWIQPVLDTPLPSGRVTACGSTWKNRSGST